MLHQLYKKAEDSVLHQLYKKAEDCVSVTSVVQEGRRLCKCYISCTRRQRIV